MAASSIRRASNGSGSRFRPPLRQLRYCRGPHAHCRDVRPVTIILALCVGYVFGMLHKYNEAKLGAALDAIFGKRPVLAAMPAGHVVAAPVVENPKRDARTIRPIFSGFAMPFGVPWRLIGCVALAALVLGSLYFYGKSRYAEGAADERVLWQAQYIEAQDRAREAEQALALDRLNRQQEAERLRVAREARLARVREEIANAPDLETQYAAYLAHRNSVRDEAAARHAGLRSDYLSSLSDGA